MSRSLMAFSPGGLWLVSSLPTIAVRQVFRQTFDYRMGWTVPVAASIASPVRMSVIAVHSDARIGRSDTNQLRQPDPPDSIMAFFQNGSMPSRAAQSVHRCPALRGTSTVNRIAVLSYTQPSAQVGSSIFSSEV